MQRQVLVQTVQKTVELPQVQLLWCCGRHCDQTARSSRPVVRFSRDSVRQSAGHSSQAHSAVLETRLLTWLCATVAPFIDKVVDIPGSEQWKCLRFSHRQSSMTISRRVWPIFRTLPKGVESRVARIFRALDGEEFFVVESYPGWRGRREFDSQVTCHM